MSVIAYIIDNGWTGACTRGGIMPNYYVTYSAKGVTHRVGVEAPTGPKAVRAARETARTAGLGRVMVSSVEREAMRGLSDVDQEKIDREIAEHLVTYRGPSLGVHEINLAIEEILGDVPLMAIERNGHILLDDGENEPADADNLSGNELFILCYEWAVYVGETSESFEGFLRLFDTPFRN